MAITINFRLVDISANADTADQLANAKGRFVEAGDIVRLYVVTSATGVKCTFGTASDIFVDNKDLVSVGTSLNKSDHMYGEFRATEDGELSLIFRETGGVSTSDLLGSVEILKEGVDF